MFKFEHDVIVKNSWFQCSGNILSGQNKFVLINIVKR